MPVILATWEAEIRRITVLENPYLLQNKQRKTDWRCGSSSRATVLQVQSPEFKHQSHQKDTHTHKKTI
jgi:hypothetical protein